MTETSEMPTGPIQAATTLRVYADCPYCQFSGEIVIAEGWYDNQWDSGKGGFRHNCQSCGVPFTISQDTVHDVQHTCLVLLGEA